MWIRPSCFSVAVLLSFSHLQLSFLTIAAAYVNFSLPLPLPYCVIFSFSKLFSCFRQSIIVYWHFLRISCYISNKSQMWCSVELKHQSYSSVIVNIDQEIKHWISGRKLLRMSKEKKNLLPFRWSNSVHMLSFSLLLCTGIQTSTVWAKWKLYET